MTSFYLGLMLVLAFRKGAILGLVLFSIYIKDLFDSLKSECKLFADDTPLFSLVHNINASAIDLNKGLEKIGNCTFK